MKNFTAIVLICFLGFLAACESDAIIVESTKSDSIPLLKRFIILDTAFTKPQDTVLVKRIVYGRDKRRVEQVVGKNFSLGDSLYSIETRFYLTPLDEKPYRRSINYYNPQFSVAYDSTFQYYRYDAANKLVYDSQRIFFKQLVTQMIYQHSYNGNEVNTVVHRPRRKEGFRTIQTTYTYNNQDVIASASTFTDSLGNSVTYKGSFSYDNNFNPLHILHTGNPHIFDPLYFYDQGISATGENIQLHNFLSGDVKSGSNTYSFYPLSYQYNSNGNPAAAWFTDTEGRFTTPGKKLKVIFEYY